MQNKQQTPQNKGRSSELKLTNQNIIEIENPRVQYSDFVDRITLQFKEKLNMTENQVLKKRLSIIIDKYGALVGESYLLKTNLYTEFPNLLIQLIIYQGKQGIYCRAYKNIARLLRIAEQSEKKELVKNCKLILVEVQKVLEECNKDFDQFCQKYDIPQQQNIADLFSDIDCKLVNSLDNLIEINENKLIEYQKQLESLENDENENTQDKNQKKIVKKIKDLYNQINKLKQSINEFVFCQQKWKLGQRCGSMSQQLFDSQTIDWYQIQEF